MVSGLYLYSTCLSTTQSAFTTQVCIHPFTHTFTHIGQVTSLQRAKLLIWNSDTHIHTPMTQPLGAIWGSVSCPRTLQHVDPTFWLVEDPLYLLSHSRPLLAFCFLQSVLMSVLVLESFCPVSMKQKTAAVGALTTWSCLLFCLVNGGGLV